MCANKDTRPILLPGWTAAAGSSICEILTHSDDRGWAPDYTPFVLISLSGWIQPNWYGCGIQGITGATISSRAVIRGVTGELERFQEAFYGGEEAMPAQATQMVSTRLKPLVLAGRSK